MKLIRYILFFVGFYPIQLVAQADVSLAIRGKYLPMGGLEDSYGLTYTYGGEIILNDRQSIGIDGNMYRFRLERDNDEDTEAMYSEIQRRTYGLVDYKLLMYFKPEALIYLTFYHKWDGKYWMWYKTHKYDFGDSDVSFLKSTERGRFHESGLGLGMKNYFSKSGFGLDWCLGLGYRIGVNEFYHHRSTYDVKSTQGIQFDQIKAYARLNLFYQISVRRGKGTLFKVE